MDANEQSVLIVGLGRMGLAHAAIIRHIPGARVAALVDPDKGLGRMAASMGLNAPFFTDLDAALERTPHLTAAYVCAPTFAHEPIVARLIEAGLHVFVEKPLGHTLTAARRMTALAKSKGLITAVGYNLSGERTFSYARRLLAEGALGRPLKYEASALHGEVFKPRKGWLFDPDRSGGGAAANIGTHILYYVLSCFGLPHTLTGETQRLYSEQVEDDARLTCHHRALDAGSGVEGTIHIGWSIPNKPILEFALSVHGEQGSLQVTRREIILSLESPWGDYAAGDHRIHEAELPTTARYNFSPEYGGEGYYVESERFLKACAAGTTPEVDFQVGVDVERFLDALYRSADSGGTTVRLEPEEAKA